MPKLAHLSPQEFAADIARLDLRTKDVVRVLAISERTVRALKRGDRRITRQQAVTWRRFIAHQIAL